MLILRNCRDDLKSYNDFQWPASGHVEAPDWAPTKECGNGLHGLSWGEGNIVHFDTYDFWNNGKCKYLVVDVPDETVIDLNGKVKFPRGYVVYCGDRDGAVAYIMAHGGFGRKVCFASVTVGKGQNAVVGHSGTATAGYGGTATAGDSGTATAGHRGTATAGHRGTATAGDSGTATAGDSGTATAGYGGTATAGYGGKVKAGNGGILQIVHFHNVPGQAPWVMKKRIKTAYVGEDGIQPNVAYKLDEAGKFVPVEPIVLPKSCMSESCCKQEEKPSVPASAPAACCSQDMPCGGVNISMPHVTSLSFDMKIDSFRPYLMPYGSMFFANNKS